MHTCFAIGDLWEHKSNNIEYDRKQNIHRQRLEFPSGIRYGRHTHKDVRLRGEYMSESVYATGHFAQRAHPPLRLRS